MKSIRPESPTRHPAPGTRHPAPGCYALAVAAALAVISAASCTKRNPYKCNLAEPCPLAEAPFCDIQGDFGDPYHCVAQPALDGGPSDGGPDSTVPADDAGPDAMLDAQMVDAAVCGGNVCTGNTPVCNMATGLCRACGLAPADCGTGRYCAPSGACVECLATSQCTTAATRPLCETTTNMCRGCATPGECAAVNSLTPQCKSNGACVGCTASTQCGNGLTPICSSTTDSCRSCNSGTECAAKDPTLPQCASAGNCVQCTTSVHCGTGATPICNGTNQCVGCTSGTQCAAKNPALPQCAGTGACVQCALSTQCSGATTPICAGNACRACAGGAECAARSSGTPACKPTGECVQCLVSTDCSGNTPICDTTPNTCRACRLDTECASGVCDESPGNCADESNVIYVAPGGAAGQCTRAAPCATFAQGLARVTGPRNTILAAQGAYPTSFTLNTTLRIVGTGTGAIMTVDAQGVPVITLTLGGALTLENVTVSDTTMNNPAISCNSGSLTLLRAMVRNANGHGISADTCTVTIDRSRISDNRAGGIILSSSGYAITNTFIVDNGFTTVPGSIMGGVSITGPPAGGPTRFDNNTVTGNATGSSAQSAGITCVTGGASLPMVNNIVWNNPGSPQTAGNCAFSNSDVQGITAGNGNINVDPLFVAPGSDYHIRATSPCRSAGNNTGATDHDFDGEARPRPAATNVDIGADEIP